MQSKRVARLEHQLSENIKATQQRIWTGVTKDVGFLRRILNEINLMKFKVTIMKRFFNLLLNLFLRFSPSIQTRRKKSLSIYFLGPYLVPS